MSRHPRLWLVFGVLLIFAVARAPLHVFTWPLPLSNDDAVPLLMARHLLTGEFSTILWNQPYNGALDAYLLAPALLLGSAHAVFRLYELICALLLVLGVGLVARRVAGEPAGWAAAGLCAFGTPYMVLMAATGPTPNFLMPLLGVLPLVAGLIALDQPSSLTPRRFLLVGVIAGLGLWNSALALPAAIGIGVGLLAAGLRVTRSVLLLPLGLLVGASPLLVARALGASGSSTVTALRPRWLWAAGLSDLTRAASGLFGLQVPLVVDGPERSFLPPGMGFVLAAGLLILVGVGGARRRALPLWGWAMLLAGAFAFSRRTGGDEVRYLYQLVVPILSLAGIGLAWLWARSRVTAAALAVTLLVPWGVGHWMVRRAWSDPRHAARVWQVPPLGPALAALTREGIQSAYASLQFAGRLGLESEEAVIASQAWNERIPGDPLRFRDEVDLDPQAAWVLSPRLSRGMPRAGGMRSLLGEMGGQWAEDEAGDHVVFRSFRPPYDEARPVPRASLSVFSLDGTPLPGVVFDRDVSTVWTSSTGLARGAGLRVRVQPARPLTALVLAVDLEHSPLGVSWVMEADGKVVSEGPRRYGLQWVNGAPRAGKQALLVVSLGAIPPPTPHPPAGQQAGELRLIFQASGPPLSVSEVFVYGSEEPVTDPRGAEAARSALAAARAGHWDEAVRFYAEAARLDPERASYHAAVLRARWRAEHRRHLDVESLGDGGENLLAGR